MRFVFWQNIVSPHQEAHLTALARLGHDVVLVAERESMPSRLKMGWAVPEMRGVEIVVAPSDLRIQEQLRAQCDESVHVFLGTRGFPMVEKAFRLSKRCPVRRGLLVENRPQQGLKGALRSLLYRVDGIQNQRFVDFVLVIGYGGKYGGKRLFMRSGYPPEKLFPYGYFVDRVCPMRDREPNSVFRLAFVGTLDRNKRCDILICALAHMREVPWRLEVIGDGPERTSLRRTAEEMGLQDRVTFHGYLPSGQVPGFLASVDLLVLPSNHDGWGVVVNEALMEGVPVICSDACGASELIGEDWRGDVFERGSEDSLRTALERWISRGPLTSVERLRIRDWSKCIAGDAAAQYFLSVVHFALDGDSRPSPPWSLAEEGAA